MEPVNRSFGSPCKIKKSKRRGEEIKRESDSFFGVSIQIIQQLESIAQRLVHAGEKNVFIKSK